MIIPHRLMMSEFHAKVDPDLGHVHRDNAKLLKGDNGLALYLMQELLKGEGSFYWPYLRVLPTPHNLRHWSEESLLELQDQKLLGRTALRMQQLRALYRDTMGVLSRIYPDLFPVRVHVHMYVRHTTLFLVLRCAFRHPAGETKRNAMDVHVRAPAWLPLSAAWALLTVKIALLLLLWTVLYSTNCE